MSATNVQFSVGVHIMQVLHAHADDKVTSSSITKSVNADAGSVRLVLAKLAKAGLGSVEIQDSRGSLFVIQASDGTIRFD